MKTKINKKIHILRILADKKRHKPGTISKESKISRPTCNIYLKELLSEKKIIKKGSGAHIAYKTIIENISEQENIHSNHHFSYQTTQVLDNNFYKYDVDGKLLKGVEGFLRWCKNRTLDPYKKYTNYQQTLDRIEHLRNSCGLLDGTQKFLSQNTKTSIDTVYYADQYNIPEFGRSRLAEIAFYGKSLQNQRLLDIVVKDIFRKLECLIRTGKFDALAFTPPSIDHRPYQIMDMIDKSLSHYEIPRIQLVKYYPGDITITQKSLKKRQDRIRNAQNSIHVYDNDLSNYKKVLLLDDFVGSGATLNETANKLKLKGVQEVIGFAIVGNLDLSYEVINEI